LNRRRGIWFCRIDSRPMNPDREPAHSRVRLTVSAHDGHAACGPNSAPPAPMGPFCVRPAEAARFQNRPLAKSPARRGSTDGANQEATFLRVRRRGLA
jgi:hypothetical protein